MLSVILLQKNIGAKCYLNLFEMKWNDHEIKLKVRGDSTLIASIRKQDKHQAGGSYFSNRLRSIKNGFRFVKLFFKEMYSV